MQKSGKVKERKKELKQLDLTANKFTANGNTYLIKKSLSLARYRQYEKYEQLVGFGVSFEQLFERLKELWELINKSKFAESAVLIHNTMQGVKEKIEDKSPALMRMCTLFIIKEGDDETKWSEERAEEYIEDWGKDYYVDNFFQLAVNLARGFLPALKELSRDILEEGAENQEALNISQDGQQSETSFGQTL